MKAAKAAIILVTIIILSGCSAKSNLIKQLSSFNWIIAVPRTDLTGSAFEKPSGRIIKGATVFLNNTTLITKTDSAGKFYFKNVPLGNYDLYIIESFSAPYKERISIYGNTKDPYIINIGIENNETSAGNLSANELVEVVKKKQNQRLNKLNDILFNPELENFKNIIIGNYDKCRLLNPEALNITTEQKGSSETTTFTADEPLYITNRHLGYELLVVLNKASLSSVQSYYYMKIEAGIAFKELFSADTNETMEWSRKRVEAFTGSQRHFFAALIQNKLEEAGFTVFMPPSSSSSISIGIPGSYSRTEAGPVPVYDLRDYLKPTNRSFEYEMSYPEILQVNHLYKMPDYNKQKLYGESKTISTLISFQNKPIRINNDGNIMEGTIYETGYWTVQQLSDMMPADYIPRPSL